MFELRPKAFRPMSSCAESFFYSVKIIINTTDMKNQLISSYG